jgi:SNF2 family DNA or RNA helicase
MLYYLHHNMKERGPFLVISPLSAAPHWQREIEGWTDMNCIYYHGNADSRELLQNCEFVYYDERLQPIPNIYKFHVLITTYEMIIADSSILGRIPWKYVVVDEAHRLKNKVLSLRFILIRQNSKLMEHLQTFKADHWLLLSGTPLQNNLEELWSLLNLIDPKEFPFECIVIDNLAGGLNCS